MDAIAEATEWLNNTSDYDKGLQILNSLGCDAFTFALLSSGADNFNREKLYTEISKHVEKILWGISETATEMVLNHLKEEITKELEAKSVEPINNDILDELKVKQSALMDERSELKAKLRFLAEDKTKQSERKKIAFEILELSDKLNLLEDDKNFFLQFGYLPSGLPEPEDNPIDLLKRQGTLRTYIVRYQKPGTNPDKLKQYQEELAIVDAKLKKHAL